MGRKGGNGGRNGHGRVWVVKEGEDGGICKFACQPVVRGGPGQRLAFVWRGPSGDEAPSHVAADLSDVPWFGVGSDLVPLRTGDLVEFVADDVFDGCMIVLAAGRTVRVRAADFRRL